MRKSRVHVHALAAFSLVLFTGILSMTGCGGSSTPAPAPSNPTGTVSTFISDPPTCSAMYSRIYVTVVAVEANESADALPGAPGWHMLVDLTKNPKQVDLLSLNPGATQNFCSTLSMLGKGSVPPGKYQEIMLILQANNVSATVTGNACSTGYNCVFYANATTSEPLNVQGGSSGHDDIIIPASQIANGGLTVAAGQDVDLNIDFDSCASILPGSSGQYDLNPVLRAGEVTQSGSNTISGKVVEGYNSLYNGMGIPNAPVLLEQRDNSTTPPTDRVVWATTTDNTGAFAFCPVPSDASNYDLVTTAVTAMRQTTPQGTDTYVTTIYNPTVFFSVAMGDKINFSMYAETSSSTNTVYPPPGPDLSQVGATISGQIQTSGSSSGINGNIRLYALQTVTDPNGNTVNVTIPVLSAGSTPSGSVTDSHPPFYRASATTSTNGGCATSSADCVAYSLIVPPGVPSIGSYSGGGILFTGPPTTNPATYILSAVANGSEETLNCTSPSGGSASSSSITVTPGSTVDQTSQSTLNLDLSGCTAP